MPQIVAGPRVVTPQSATQFTSPLAKPTKALTRQTRQGLLKARDPLGWQQEVCFSPLMNSPSHAPQLKAT